MTEELKIIPQMYPTDPSELEGSVSVEDDGLKEAELLGRNLTQQQIKRRAEENEAHRNEKFRDHFELISIISLWAFFILFGILILSWFYHYIMPVNWHWLTAEQLAKVQTLATGGIVATIAAGHMKKRLG